MTGADAGPLYHTGHLLRRAQQLHQALWNREVSSEVSSVQFAALLVIRQRPGLSQAELCDELDLDRSTIADLVDRMVRRGLLARAQSTEDRRRKVLTITERGASTLDEINPGVERVDALLTETLAASERDELRSMLRRMLAHGVETGTLR
ncbi:MarR family transcriptional regulator [Leucobacter sp. gxy201]|uniref:MarR family winged helix-turn-helix transcriptional regulator n=1 Tax=Leucobacter sp. gxy201 TaxID=2957200 RepID=UPI003DA05680